MTLTVHISEAIRCVFEEIPKSVVMQKQGSVTIRQIAEDIGIPPILIVFASVDGARRKLDDLVTGDAQIHLFGSMAGG